MIPALASFAVGVGGDEVGPWVSREMVVDNRPDSCAYQTEVKPVMNYLGTCIIPHDGSTVHLRDLVLQHLIFHTRQLGLLQP